MKRRSVPGNGYGELSEGYRASLTRPVGSTFVARTKNETLAQLKVVKDKTCFGCWYDCNARRCGAPLSESGFCDELRRADGVSVQFVVIKDSV